MSDDNRNFKAFSDLPFVDADAGSYWRVPPTDDCGLAREIGREYAACFVQYLKGDPQMYDGIFGDIATHIDFEDESANKGYWFGFFDYLTHLIRTQALHMDVFADVQGLSRYTRSVSHLLACADHKELPDYVLSDIAWLLEGLAALAEQVTWTRSEASTQLHKKGLTRRRGHIQGSKGG